MKFKIRLLLFVLFLSLFLVAAKSTYARYATSTTGEANLNMAQWQISVNNQNITENYNTQLSFTPVIEENENVKSGTVAPGSTGYFDIQINPEKVDVSFSYNIMLQLPEDSVVSDLKITHYAIIPSGQDDNSIQKIPYTGSSIENVLKYDNQTSNFKFPPFTVRVYFEWYDGQDNLMDDAADTEVSQKVNNSEDVDFNILASLSFKQYNGE
ncbi:MAG: hypothetical protein UC703_06640 [Bacilli bacterium]|nr:hypothetical protein [Bacilli bacterium]